MSKNGWTGTRRWTCTWTMFLLSLISIRIGLASSTSPSPSPSPATSAATFSAHGQLTSFVPPSLIKPGRSKSKFISCPPKKGYRQALHEPFNMTRGRECMDKDEGKSEGKVGDDLILNNEMSNQMERRNFLSNLCLIPAMGASALTFTTNIQPASARGLVRFPCNNYSFFNKYHFMRAGQSILESEEVWSTNPLFLTNREAALSPEGIEQVELACQELKSEGVAPTVVRYSLAASAIDSSNIIGKELKVGRDRLVPEFNFLDPRAIGLWDMSQLGMTQHAVWAMDEKEAGKDGKGGRPPENEDGTPNETLADQVVRLQQLISVTETQNSGDTILLVFPDGTGPALLSCLIGGVPLNRVHEFEYANGEIRLNIDYESASALIGQEPSEAYVNAITDGQKKLTKLRDNPEMTINVKDLAYEEELRISKLEEERKANEKKRIAEEQKAAEELEKTAKLSAKEERKAEERKYAEAQRTAKEIQRAIKPSVSSSPSPSSSPSEAAAIMGESEISTIDPAVFTIGGITLAAAAVFSSLFNDEDTSESVSSDRIYTGNMTMAETDDADVRTKKEREPTILPAIIEPLEESPTQKGSNIQNTNENESKKPVSGIPSSLMKDDVKLIDIDAIARQNNDSDDLEEETDDASSSSMAVDPVDREPVKLSRPDKAWDPDEDDGGLAWLGSLSEMIAEDTDLQEEGLDNFESDSKTWE